MKLLINFVLVLLLGGCGHSLELVSRNNSGNGSGNAGSFNNKVSITINDQHFKGVYVHDGLRVVTTTNAFSGSVYNSRGSNSFYGNSSSSFYSQGSGNGKMVAHSTNNSLYCDFNFIMFSGVGYCRDKYGQEYDLIID
jgi:hypothetical protein